MNTKTILAALCSLLLAAACKKNTPQPSCAANNAGVLTGTAYYIDYTTGQKLPLAHQPIVVSLSTAGPTILPAPDTTDASGNFTIYGLDTCSTLYVYSIAAGSSSPSANLIPYFGQVIVSRYGPQPTRLTLVDTVDSNATRNFYSGLNIITADDSSGRLANVKVTLYFSPEAAAYDSSFLGANSYTSFITDSTGQKTIVFSTPPPQAIIYANAMTIIHAAASADTLWARAQAIRLQRGFGTGKVVLLKK